MGIVEIVHSVKCLLRKMRTRVQSSTCFKINGCGGGAETRGSVGFPSWSKLQIESWGGGESVSKNEMENN